MSLYTVAQLAGVSASTVSRVINQHPNVSASTAETVRRAMRELSFTPSIRTRTFRPRSASGLRTGAFAFVVFGTSGSQPTPAFEQLLRGVSEQASRHNLSLIFSFVSDPSQLPPRVHDRGVDGLLLHGERPSREVQARLQTLPTVWLMANRQRPTWGDQVMPDNLAIGTLAAKYLLERGHRRLAYLGTRSSWSLELRSLAFAHAAREVGVHVDVLETTEETGADFWQRDGLQAAASSLVERFARLNDRPTGLFIAEDRLVPRIDAQMRAAHLMNGDAIPRTTGAIDIISCNNERAQFIGMQRIPATIDICAESIGRLGVERLMWRVANPDLVERTRCMVEPFVVQPTTSLASQDVADSSAASQAFFTSV